MTETVERRMTERGELALRRDGDRYEIISNGVFLMDTSDGRSERLLVTAALAAVEHPRRILLGGLGVGFSLAAAVADDRLTGITVVEREPTVVDWQDRYLSRYSRGAAHDPRVDVVVDDLVPYISRPGTRYDAICLDIDNGPEWTVTDGNAALYSADGLRALADRLADGGALAVWSSGAAPEFEQRLTDTFRAVRVLPVDVPRGEPDLVYLARRR